jgi:hypothetical protein
VAGGIDFLELDRETVGPTRLHLVNDRDNVERGREGHEAGRGDPQPGRDDFVIGRNNVEAAGPDCEPAANAAD